MGLRSKQDSLGFKMGLGFGMVGLILIGGLMATILQIGAISTSSNMLSKDYVPVSDLILKMSQTTNQLTFDTLKTQESSNSTLLPRNVWRDRTNLFMEDLDKYSSSIRNEDFTNTLIGINSELSQLDEYNEEYRNLISQNQHDAAKRLLNEKIMSTVIVLQTNLGKLSSIRQAETINNLANIRVRVERILINDWAFLSVGFILCILLGIVLTKSITTPIAKLVNITQNLAKGKLGEKFDIKGTLEFERLSSSLSNMSTAFEDLARITEKISEGDYSSRVTVRSEDDKLAISVNQMLENFTQTVDQANAISEGNYNLEIIPRSDQDKLGVAIRNMTLTLRHNKERNDEANWIKDGVAMISNTISGVHDLGLLCDRAISTITRYTESAVGVIYIFNKEKEELYLLGSFAYSNRDSLSNRFKLGEGIIGQTALEKKPILLKNVPHEEQKISTGTLEIVPTNISSMPIIHENELLGVIEISSHKYFNEQDKLLFDSILPIVATQMKAAQQQTLTQKLLSESKLLTEKLQIQQEELKATNEELEQQTQVLKASEEELRLKDEEQQRVNKKLEERTQELEKQKTEIEENSLRLQKTRDALKEKAEELEQASKYKSEFLANMSHELRTPLNSLLILAKMFVDNEEHNLTDEQVECASIMLKSGQDLLTLINDILDLAKVEAGKIELILGNYALHDFTEQVKRDFSHVAEKKGIQLVSELGSNLPNTIFTDDHRVSQVIRNLISNALKFTEHGQVKFKIDRPEPDDNINEYGLLPEKTIAFSVSDTGIGIPPEKQSLIFESFQQADSSTSRRYGGTGLGLTISLQLAKLLGGGIKLKSKAGEGSTFTLYLPEEVPSKKSESTSSPVKEASEKNEQSFPKKSCPINFKVSNIADDRSHITEKDEVLLIVEDDEQFTKILMNICRKKGFKCLYSNNAELGLELAQAYQPKGILLDIGLPGMDGLTMLDALKSDPVTKFIPVHVISASENSASALKKGAVGYLMKPVNQEQLEATLQKLENISKKNIRDLLIVEDNLPLLEAMQKLFKGKNVNITGVHTGSDALTKLKKQHFDCMILDLTLPDMSGKDLLLEYHKIPHNDPPAIIIHTGKTLSESENSLLTNYADSIIIKSGTASMDRLIEETNMFLHRVSTDENGKKLKEIKEPKRQKKEFVAKNELSSENITDLNRKVLVVDDDMRNVFALSKSLKSKGYSVMMASNGKNAIETLENNKDIDIVLMDIMMPIMDGYDAIKKIRENSEFNSIPIIAVTAKAMKGDMEKCIEIGATDFLPKPINIDDLLMKLKKWLKI